MRVLSVDIVERWKARGGLFTRMRVRQRQTGIGYGAS